MEEASAEALEVTLAVEDLADTAEAASVAALEATLAAEDLAGQVEVVAGVEDHVQVGAADQAEAAGAEDPGDLVVDANGVAAVSDQAGAADTDVHIMEAVAASDVWVA